jgi:hypothetical protein
VVAGERVDAPLREPRRRLHPQPVGHGPPRRRHRRHHLIDAAQQPQRLPVLLPQGSSLPPQSPPSCTPPQHRAKNSTSPVTRYSITASRQPRLKNSEATTGSSKTQEGCELVTCPGSWRVRRSGRWRLFDGRRNGRGSDLVRYARTTYANASSGRTGLALGFTSTRAEDCDG